MSSKLLAGVPGLQESYLQQILIQHLSINSGQSLTSEVQCAVPIAVFSIFFHCFPGIQVWFEPSPPVERRAVIGRFTTNKISQKPRNKNKFCGSKLESPRLLVFLCTIPRIGPAEKPDHIGFLSCRLGGWGSRLSNLEKLRQVFFSLTPRNRIFGGQGWNY